MKNRIYIKQRKIVNYYIKNNDYKIVKRLKGEVILQTNLNFFKTPRLIIIGKRGGRRDIK